MPSYIFVLIFIQNALWIFASQIPPGYVSTESQLTLRSLNTLLSVFPMNTVRALTEGILTYNELLYEGINEVNR